MDTLCLRYFNKKRSDTMPLAESQWSNKHRGQYWEGEATAKNHVIA